MRDEMAWEKVAPSVYRSGLFSIYKPTRRWYVSHDGNLLGSYRSLWLAKHMAYGWLRTHPEHGLRVVQGGGDTSR